MKSYVIEDPPNPLKIFNFYEFFGQRHILLQKYISQLTCQQFFDFFADINACSKPPIAKCVLNQIRNFENGLGITSRHTKRKCGVCAKYISKQNMKRHIRTHADRKNGYNEHNIVCVDKNNGVFLVDSQRKGCSYPLHVQVKMFDGENILKCSSKYRVFVK